MEHRLVANACGVRPVVTLALLLPPTALVKEGGQSSLVMPFWPNRGPWGVLQWGQGELCRTEKGLWGLGSGLTVLLTKLGDGFMRLITLFPPPLYMLANVHEEKLRLKIAL